VGITGKNREGMQKYRRFAENPKERCVRSPAMMLVPVVNASVDGMAQPTERPKEPSRFRHGTTGISRRF